jgi:hypothetical protein
MVYNFSGVRASSDISAGFVAVWWRQGSRGLLHHTMRRHLREDRHEDPDIRRSAPGGRCSNP